MFFNNKKTPKGKKKSLNMSGTMREIFEITRKLMEDEKNSDKPHEDIVLEAIDIFKKKYNIFSDNNNPDKSLSNESK